MILFKKYHIFLKSLRLFSSHKQRQKILIIDDPSQYTKLIFDKDKKCKIFQHVRGQNQVRWLTRASTAWTVLNTFLFSTQYANPIFGGWNGISFGVCMSLGYLSLLLLNVFTRRIVHEIHLHNNLRILEITFFNAFWKPKKIMFHISQFQQPTNSYMGFTRFQLTSLGKIWINLQKNKYKNNKDYEQIMSYVCMGKPLTAQFQKKKNN